MNLSPYEKDRIIKEDFGKTEMGRDLLAQDYLLKQITASLIYPQDSLGKKFWDKVYSEAQKQYGTTNIPVNTFNKVWIVPDEADIYEKGNTAYLYKSHLKVMLEEDYFSLEKHTGIQGQGDSNKTHQLGAKIVRAVILPELEKEVNQGKNFASLRQVFSGMILAAWYKRALRKSILSQVYADKAKVKGVDQDPRNNEIIYRQYLQAFKKGVFNFIKEDMDKYTNETIPRKYFSGGAIHIDQRNLHVNLPGAVLQAMAAMKRDSAMAGDDIAETKIRIATGSGFDAAMTLEENAERLASEITQWHADAYTLEKQDQTGRRKTQVLKLLYKKKIETRLLAIMSRFPQNEMAFQMALTLFTKLIMPEIIRQESDLDLNEWSVARIFAEIVQRGIRVSGIGSNVDLVRSVGILINIFQSTEGQDPLFRALFINKFMFAYRSNTLRLSLPDDYFLVQRQGDLLKDVRKSYADIQTYSQKAAEGIPGFQAVVISAAARLIVRGDFVESHGFLDGVSRLLRNIELRAPPDIIRINENSLARRLDSHITSGGAGRTFEKPRKSIAKGVPSIITSNS